MISFVPEKLELAFRYVFVDKPDSNSIREARNKEEFTVATNYFIARYNKVTGDYFYLTLDGALDKCSNNDNRVRLQWGYFFVILRGNFRR